MRCFLIAEHKKDSHQRREPTYNNIAQPSYSQPAVSGYIEFAGEIVKISSVEDIERVLEKFRG